MDYKKPQIIFRKFCTEAFLEEGLSSNGGGHEHGGGYGKTDMYNGEIVLDSTGVGGWFNG